MKKWHLLCFLGLLLSTLGFAKGGPTMLHGGVGFLFPDANEFINPGQLALNRGFAMQANYLRTNGSQEQSLTPSMVLGGGNFGIGVYGNRFGPNLASPFQSTDVVGGALALSLLKDHITFGVLYDREISIGQVSDGNLSVSLNYNGKARTGLSVGVKGTSTVNALYRNRSATAGIGFGFTPLINAEVYYRMNNVELKSDTAIGAAFTLAGRVTYLSGGYEHLNIPSVGRAVGRLGVNWGILDLSARFEKTLSKNHQYSYGGSMRFSF